MSGLPWAKFYPADWMRDPGLRRCSYAARGLWMDMLCLMFEGEGYLRFGGVKLTAKEVGSLTGGHHLTVGKLLAELEAYGVFSRTEDGTIYSRRIVRDAVKARADQENGRKGGNPALMKGVNPSPNPPPNPSDKARASRDLEVRSQKLEESSSRVVLCPDAGTTTNLVSFQERAGASFGGDQAKLKRVMRGVTNAVHPKSYLTTCLAEAPAPPDQPAMAVVWVSFGSAAWFAWDAADPQLALETRSRPGERGRWRPTEFPAGEEMRA